MFPMTRALRLDPVMTRHDDWVSTLVLSTLLLGLTLSAGCPRGTSIRDDPSLSQQVVEVQGESQLGPQDVLFVRVYAEPEMSGEFRVDEDGTITFPFLGAVSVIGLTPAEVSQSIASGLADGYLIDPVVAVFIKESNSRKVFVLGHVKKPGPYRFADGMTIVEAIAVAGGVASSGAPNQTRLTRRIDGAEVNYTVKVSAISTGDAANVALLPGDIVYVPRSPI